MELETEVVLEHWSKGIQYGTRTLFFLVYPNEIQRDIVRKQRKIACLSSGNNLPDRHIVRNSGSTEEITRKITKRLDCSLQRDAPITSLGTNQTAWDLRLCNLGFTAIQSQACHDNMLKDIT